MPAEKTLTSPVGLDYEIEQLRLIFSAQISWLTYAMGEAKRIPYNGDKGVVYAPMVEQAYKADYFICFPSDLYQSVLFFYVPNGEMNDSNGHSYEGAYSKKVDLDIILYADMYKIDSSLQRDITRDIQQSIEYVIQKKCFRIKKIKEVYTKIEDVYRDFDYRYISEEFLHPRYCMLRFRCDLQFNPDTISSQITFVP